MNHPTVKSIDCKFYTDMRLGLVPLAQHASSHDRTEVIDNTHLVSHHLRFGDHKLKIQYRQTNPGNSSQLSIRNGDTAKDYIEFKNSLAETRGFNGKAEIVSLVDRLFQNHSKSNVYICESYDDFDFNVSFYNRITCTRLDIELALG